MNNFKIEQPYQTLYEQSPTSTVFKLTKSKKQEPFTKGQKPPFWLLALGWLLAVVALAGPTWVRPLSMFEEEVLVEGKSVPRFAYIGEIPNGEKMI